MAETKFEMKLTRKEALCLDHGRYKGMLDLMNSIEKRISDQKKEGKELDLQTLVKEFAIHKHKAKELYSKSTKALHDLKIKEEENNK